MHSAKSFPYNIILASFLCKIPAATDIIYPIYHIDLQNYTKIPVTSIKKQASQKSINEVFALARIVFLYLLCISIRSYSFSILRNSPNYIRIPSSELPGPISSFIPGNQLLTLNTSYNEKDYHDPRPCPRRCNCIYLLCIIQGWL